MMLHRVWLKEGGAATSRWRWRGCCGCRGVLVLSVLLVLTICVTHLKPSSYSPYLLRSLQGPIDVDDPELLRYIREQVLDPPSTQPYNLLGKKNIATKVIEPSETFYNRTLRQLLNETGGFFVEAGALDGESMSNSLWLEQELGWSGLLVEADRRAYVELLTKHRRAWGANVCLSPGPYPSKEMFNTINHFPGPKAQGLGFKMRSMHGLVKYSVERMLQDSWFQMVHCLPLESLLLAMGVAQVDLLVLDVEGAELAILDHLDLRKFNVQVLCMEWKRVEMLDSIAEEFSLLGYVEVARRKEDLIFVKRSSKYEKRLQGINLNDTTTEHHE